MYERQAGGGTRSREVSSIRQTTTQTAAEDPEKSPEDPSIQNALSSSDSTQPVVNVYLENSGSMNGYVDNGKTEFQQTVYNYLCDIQIAGISSEFNCNFINKQIIPKGNNVSNFINSLTPHSFKTSGGSTGTTDLAEIFGQILSNTGKDTVSVFISDCIFSPGSVADPEAYLTNQQISMKMCMAKYLESHPLMGVLVYQLYSNFDGVYYDYRNVGHQYKGRRPYYIWVIGNVPNLLKLRGFIKNEKFQQVGEGVANEWFICEGFDGTLFWGRDGGMYDILSNPRKGRFVKEKDYTLSQIQQNKNGEFMFTLGVDLFAQKTLLGEEYVMYFDNWRRLYNKLPSDEWHITIDLNTEQNSTFTHNIGLSIDNVIPKGAFCIALVANPPQWAYEMTDTDDRVLGPDNQSKTYGLKYLFDGIYQAYTSSSNCIYAKMDINFN